MSPYSSGAHWPRLLLWGLLALWFALIVGIKLDLYGHRVAVGDVFLHANAILNTHLPDQILFTATYQTERGITSLLQDHVEPTSLLLVPLYRIFDTPLFLILIQSLGAVGLVAGLIVVGRHFGAPRGLALAVAVLALYNPLFLKAVIDGPGGYRHDAQFLWYLPGFLACFLLRRPWAMMAFLLLFLGIKQSAAFYGIAFGLMVAARGLPFGSYRRLAAVTAVVSILYFALSVFVIPEMIGSPNTYVNYGSTFLNNGIFRNTIGGFFDEKWHNLYEYFYLSALQPPFFLAGLIDVSVYSLMQRPATLYYNFNVVTFFAFGALLSLMPGTATAPLPPVMPRWQRWQQRLRVLFMVQTGLAVPTGLWEMHHVWTSSLAASVTVPQRDAEAAWSLVDPQCGVAPADALLDRFHHLPFWLQPQWADRARYVVAIDAGALSEEARRRDSLHRFVAENRSHLKLLGRSGAVSVWLDPAVACRAWESRSFADRRATQDVGWDVLPR